MLCITNNSIKLQSFVYTQLNDQTVLFQAIQFSISHLFTLSFNVKQFYLTLSGVTTLGQSEPGSDDNEGALHIAKISKAGALPPDDLMLYPGHLLVGVLSLCRDVVSVFYFSSQLDQSSVFICF